MDAAVPGAQIELVPNPGPANQPSLLLKAEHALRIARFLQDDPELRLDFCSNVTGVDWPERKVKTAVKVKQVVDGEEKEVDEPAKKQFPDGTGFESMEKLRARHGLRGIALSGYGMDEDVRRSAEAGFAAHLTKPIDFAQLERALEDLMAGAAAPPVENEGGEADKKM